MFDKFLKTAESLGKQATELAGTAFEAAKTHTADAYETAKTTIVSVTTTQRVGKVVRQKMIYRTDLRANPKSLYIFGDNCYRDGYGGQAKEMRDEPNAVGIATKWNPSHHDGAFFYDTSGTLSEQVKQVINREIAYVYHCWDSGLYDTVVFPADGVGTGLSKMPETAPEAFKYLEFQFEEFFKHVEGK